MTQVKLEVNKGSYSQSLNWLVKSKAPLCGCITTSVRNRLEQVRPLLRSFFSSGKSDPEIRQHYGSLLSITEDFSLEAALQGRTPSTCKMLNKWILLFLMKEKGASVHVNKQYESKGQVSLSWEVLQSTEKVSWDTQNKPSHAHPTGCQLRLTTGVVWQKAEHKQKSWHQENLTGKWHSRTVLHIPRALAPLHCCPPVRGATMPCLSSIHSRFWKSLASSSHGSHHWNVALFSLVFILSFPELIPRDRKAKFACPQTWHCSAQKVGTDTLALHSWGSAGATPVGSAQFRLCMPLTCLLCKSGSESRQRKTPALLGSLWLQHSNPALHTRRSDSGNSSGLSPHSCAEEPCKSRL